MRSSAVDARGRAPEPRPYPRHPTCVPVRIREIPVTYAREHQRAGPVLGAVRVEVGHPVPAGALVEVGVYVCETIQRFRGRVHWVRRSGRRFEIAVQICDAEQAYRARTVEQASQIEAYRLRASWRAGRALGIEQAAARWIARHARRFAAAWEAAITPG